MIQATVDRVRDFVPASQILIVTNELLVEAMRKQLPELPPASILGEPCKRDTAPCIGLAAAMLLLQDRQATMLVMPADHVIQTTAQFQGAVQMATQLIDQDPTRVVTFGVRPTYPSESFGYIERGEQLAEGVFRVRMFREKPNQATAQGYLASGGFYWNSGIFLWRAQTIDEALRRFEPEMHRHLTAIAAVRGQPQFASVFASEFAAIRGKSIDYAVLERHQNVVVIEAPFSWDDVGGWQALARLRGADPEGNTVVGKYLGLNTQDCIVRSEGDHLIATLGMKDCIIVHTADVTLVARKQDEESVRKLVELLKEQGQQKYL